MYICVCSFYHTTVQRYDRCWAAVSDYSRRVDIYRCPVADSRCAVPVHCGRWRAPVCCRCRCRLPVPVAGRLPVPVPVAGAGCQCRCRLPVPVAGTQKKCIMTDRQTDRQVQTDRYKHIDRYRRTNRYKHNLSFWKFCV